MLYYVLSFCIGTASCITPDYLLFPTLSECERQREMLLVDVPNVVVIRDCEVSEVN
jgi:hypothetical protein